MIVFLLIVLSTNTCLCDPQTGPDPWDYEGPSTNVEANFDMPPDIRMQYSKKAPATASDKLGTGEWFFRRMLGIMLKGGQNKRNEDGSVDISLSMRLDERQWLTLEEYMLSTTSLSEDMFRRSVGLIEQAIYQPSIGEKIVMAWSDYIGIYLAKYKTYITWTLAIASIVGFIIWLSKQMSHRHLIVTIFLALYMYEVFISYKEAEKQELDRFVTAVNKCSWQFWTSSCDVPAPDPVVFLKHMNPLKIGIRMFTTLISEPLIILSDTLKTMVSGITDGLWYPFDRIVYGILILMFNVILLLLLVSIVCNYILNIPMNFGFLGLMSVGLKQRNRTFFTNNNSSNGNVVNNARNVEESDRISGPTLNRLLDVFAQALNNPNSQNSSDNVAVNRFLGPSRSATSTNHNRPVLKNVTKRKNVKNVVKRKNLALKMSNYDGSGDAH